MQLVRAAVTLTFLVSANVVFACPFCSAPSLTRSEELAQADVAVLVKWAGAEKGDVDKPGSTTYEIVEPVKGPRELKTGGEITLVRYRAGREGDLFLLTGTRTTGIEWNAPLEVSEASYKYIKNAPPPSEPTQKRLKYFINYLEFPDQLVANDAYAEFANAPYKDIAPLAKSLPRERIRKWIVDPETPATRLGLYGLLLGLCGRAEDARLMEKKILEQTGDFRLGIDGVMSGYLLLVGEEGLDVIDEHKLKSKKVPFSETYAAMQALRFMWTYAPDVIEKDRLRESMRILLDRPELADLVIADLARWKDWSVQEKLMELYGKGEYNIPSIKRAIIRYMLVSTKDRPKSEANGGSDASPPEHVARGEEYLAELRKRDPKTVRDAERFFFLQ